MLRCVFGWQGDIDTLIRWELRQHKSTSASCNILSKWLGEVGADTANIIGSESMTSSDWMLLALNTIDKDSQKKVGDAFVQRLLEKGEVHPAAAIHLGLGESHEAIEIYVSRQMYLEAVLLTCLLFPDDWQRLQHLVRQWGEYAVTNKEKLETELAVRCFACAAAETTEPWFSPSAKDAIYMAQMQYMGPDVNPSPTMSSNSATSPGGSRRPQFASLQPLITSFSNQSKANGAHGMDDKTPMVGMTPIDAPDGAGYNQRFYKDPQSSITATPGGLTSRRLHSRDRGGESFTPIASSRTAKPMSAVRSKHDDQLRTHMRAGPNEPTRIGEPPNRLMENLASPAGSGFTASTGSARLRNGSRARKPENLMLDTSELVRVDPSLASSMTSTTQASSVRIRPIDDFVSSVHEARSGSRRPESRTTDRGVSRGRAASESRQVRYVRPSKPSPSSPISMSPDDPALRVERVFRGKESESDAERFYRVASPVDSSGGRQRRESNAGRTSSRTGPRRTESADRQGRPPSRTASRNKQRGESRETSNPDRDRDARGRGRSRPPGSESPFDDSQSFNNAPKPREQSIGARVRSRGASMNRNAASPEPGAPRQRSQSARAEQSRAESPPRRRQMSRSRMPRLQTSFSDEPVEMKRTAAIELELRRQSLAKKTSGNIIVHPAEYMASPKMMQPEEDIIVRSHTTGPEYGRLTKSPGGSMRESTSYGLPSNPGAMRHMSVGQDWQDDDIPAVPQISDVHIQAQQSRTDLSTLPAVAFRPPSRVGSAPPEKSSMVRKDSNSSLQLRPTVHGRMGSITGMLMSDGSDNQQPPPPPPPAPPGAMLSGSMMVEPADEPAVLGSEVMIIADSDILQPEPSPQAVIPELQHLMHPQGSTHKSRKDSIGVINIAIDDGPGSTPAPHAGIESALAATQSNSQNSNSLSSKFRNVRDRMRDRSTARGKSPPRNIGRSPYESIPDQTIESFRVGSAPPASMQAPPMNGLSNASTFPSGDQLGGLLLPATTYVPPGIERPQTTAPPSQGMPNNMTGYRNPKDIAKAMRASMMAPPPPLNSSVAAYTNPKQIRANMPPSSTQPGSSPYNFL
jgi:hypothetical protein